MDGPPKALSGREREVLALVARGLTNAEAARELGISPLTVKKHLERMFEAVGAANRAELVARSLRGSANGSRSGPPRHNLPAPLTSFVGRAREIAEVAALLERSRLVTLGGPGGIGKTRLAIEVARRVLDRFPDGVWLVELADLADGRALAKTVVTALGMREASRGRTADVAAALRERHLLLVLDNCEHLGGACAALVEALQHTASGVRVLATSREPLGVSGEAVIPVPTLAIAEEAVPLFVERATLRAPGFTLSADNARTLAAICDRLDGMPLAIELAAARMNVLSVHEIAARLGDRFTELRSGDARVVPRHRTLRGAIDWSYQLLARMETRVFERLAAFAGSFTLSAAEAVVPGEGIEAAEVLAALSHLVDKSFVMADARGEIARYRLLETLREYARERLERSPDAALVRARHAAYFAALAEEAELHLKGPGQAGWFARLDRSREDLRAALRWSLAHAPHTAVRLAAALWRYWFHRGLGAEGARWLEEALAAAPRDLDVRLRASALNGAANLAVALDPDRAQALHRECLALRRALGDDEGIVGSLSNLSDVARKLDRLDEAGVLAAEAIGIAQRKGYTWYLGVLEVGRAALALRGADVTGARMRSLSALRHLRRARDPVRTGHALANLALAEHVGGRHARAVTLHRRALVLFGRAVDAVGMSYVLGPLGAAEAARSRHELAATLLASGRAALERLGYHSDPIHASVVAEGDEAVRRALDGGTLAAAAAAGQAMTLDEAVALALSGAG